MKDRKSKTMSVPDLGPQYRRIVLPGHAKMDLTDKEYIAVLAVREGPGFHIWRVILMAGDLVPEAVNLITETLAEDTVSLKAEEGQNAEAFMGYPSWYSPN
jgi:hypothetical protein